MTRLDLLLSGFLKMVVPIVWKILNIVHRVPGLQQVPKLQRLTVFKLTHFYASGMS